ncbi:MAG: hypothetical protein KC657_01275 [Myxococcales bacterium]|nr:hypothetical protein [Myxococcales bacterium]
MRRHTLALALTLVTVAACGGQVDSVPSAPATSGPTEDAPEERERDRGTFIVGGLPPGPPVTTKELEAACAKLDRRAPAKPLPGASALREALVGGWYACDGATVTEELLDRKGKGAVGLYFDTSQSAFLVGATEQGEVKPSVCVECAMYVSANSPRELTIGSSPDLTADFVDAGTLRLARASEPQVVRHYVHFPR